MNSNNIDELSQIASDTEKWGTCSCVERLMSKHAIECVLDIISYRISTSRLLFILHITRRTEILDHIPRSRGEVMSDVNGSHPVRYRVWIACPDIGLTKNECQHSVRVMAKNGSVISYHVWKFDRPTGIQDSVQIVQMGHRTENIDSIMIMCWVIISINMRINEIFTHVPFYELSQKES
jgi:hypothetical protein